MEGDFQIFKSTPGKYPYVAAETYLETNLMCAAELFYKNS